MNKKEYQKLLKGESPVSHSGIPSLVSAVQMALLYLDGDYVGTDEDLRFVLIEALKESGVKP